MIKKYLDENIFLIDGFLTQSECDGILNDTWENWQEDLKSKVSLALDNKFTIEGQCNIRTLSEGESIYAHSDQHIDECECAYCLENPEVVFIYGLVLYLNDNFTGGKLRYLKNNIEYVPKSGDLVCHPASIDYEHEVLKVESGVRKFIPFLIKKSNLK